MAGTKLSTSLFERYQQEMRIRHYGARTIKTYRSQLRSWVAWLDGTHPRDVQAETIRAYLLSLVECGFDRSTIDQAISALKFLYVELYRWPDDAFHVTRPRREDELPYAPTREEVLRMATSTCNPKHRLAMLLLYATGLRVSELVALRIGDLDLGKLTVRVRAGKGRKDRITLLSERLIPELRAQIGDRPPDDLLFRGQGRRSWTVRSVQHVISAAGKRAGLQRRVHPHCMRHAFATHLLEAGVDLLIVKNLLGHRNPRTTARYIQLKDPNRLRIASPL